MNTTQHSERSPKGILEGKGFTEVEFNTNRWSLHIAIFFLCIAFSLGFEIGPSWVSLVGLELVILRPQATVCTFYHT